MNKSNNYKYLPFNFDELNNGKYIITNQTSSFIILNNKIELLNLIYMHFDKLKISLLNELIAKNFIYEQEEEDYKLKYLSTNLATKYYNNINKPNLIIIVPTLRCDLDCNYCQVSRVSETKKGYDLDKSYIDEILRVINISSDDDIKIEFQGGEPLLNFEFIKLFHLKSKLILVNKNISYVICTTLNNVNENILKWCQKNNIYISTSLDGDENTHNFNRPSKKYNSYEKFKAKYILTKKILGKENISAISTITNKTMENPKTFIDSYLELDLNSIFIRPLSLLGFANQNVKQQYSAEVFFDFYKKCLEYIFEINKEKLFIEENLLIYLKKIFRPLNTTYLDLQSPSAYMNGVLLFNYNGLIFGSDESRMLWEMTKIDNLVLGNVKNKEYDFFNKNNITILSNSFIDMNPGCKECAFVEYCGNDIFYHLVTQGDFIGNKSYSFYCKLQTLIFKYIFELIASSSYKKDILYKWLNH